jgi:hypothetical protein
VLNTHCQITSVYARDSKTVVARQQLYGHVVFPATREHALIEDTFSVRSVLGLLVADVGEISGIHMKGDVRRWKPLSSNGY